MKIKKEYVWNTTEGETVLVATGNSGFSGMVRGNRTLGVILDLLKEDTTEEDIVSAMKQRFDASEEVIARDVKKAIDELRRIGAIDG